MGNDSHVKRPFSCALATAGQSHNTQKEENTGTSAHLEVLATARSGAANAAARRT